MTILYLKSPTAFHAFGDTSSPQAHPPASDWRSSCPPHGVTVSLSHWPLFKSIATSTPSEPILLPLHGTSWPKSSHDWLFPVTQTAGRIVHSASADRFSLTPKWLPTPNNHQPLNMTLSYFLSFSIIRRYLGHLLLFLFSPLFFFNPLGTFADLYLLDTRKVSSTQWVDNKYFLNQGINN